MSIFFQRWSCKVTPKIHDDDHIPRTVPKPTLALVNVNCIRAPALVIEDIDEHMPHTWFTIAGRDKWARILRGILREYVPDDRARDVMERMNNEEPIHLCDNDNMEESRTNKL